MNKSMLDILACPIDKSYPLELFEISGSQDGISEGILFCQKCLRFYPIINGIPMMLPDELRDKGLEIKFLKRNKDSLPEKITAKSNPWHL